MYIFTNLCTNVSAQIEKCVTNKYQGVCAEKQIILNPYKQNINKAVKSTTAFNNETHYCENLISYFYLKERERYFTNIKNIPLRTEDE